MKAISEATYAGLQEVHLVGFTDAESEALLEVVQTLKPDQLQGTSDAVKSDATTAASTAAAEALTPSSIW